MNYFEFHIGDYAEATSHLSIIEDGAYGRLLRKYYASEKPLPAEMERVQRLVGARTDEERTAVETVLKEFFDLRDDGWHQARCDAAIEAYQAGAPEREIKKTNESERQRRHRAERATLFELLHQAGQYPAWNTSIADIRALVSKLPNAPVTPVTAPVTPVTAPVTGPVTACNAPATATQSPIPTSQSPLPTSHNPQEVEDHSSSEQSPDGAIPQPNRARKQHGTEDDYAAARWMVERIRKNDATFKEPKVDAWANEVRLMREHDGRDHREICELFDWCQRDPFWRANVLSPTKLREKWTSLSLKRASTPATTQTRGALMTDEQLSAKNAEETEKAKALYRQRYGDSANDENVIEAETVVVSGRPAIEGGAA